MVVSSHSDTKEVSKEIKALLKEFDNSLRFSWENMHYSVIIQPISKLGTHSEKNKIPYQVISIDLYGFSQKYWGNYH